MKEGTFNFIALLFISSLPNPSLHQLALGLHPPSFCHSLLQQIHSQKSKSFLFENNEFHEYWWTPEWYHLSFSVQQTRPRNEGRGIMGIGLNSVQLQSHWWTLFTHLLVHKDTAHLVNNMASIGASSLYLDMGFLKSAFLFLFSGLGGVVGLLVEKVLATDQDRIKLALASEMTSSFVFLDSGNTWPQAICDVTSDFLESGYQSVSSALDYINRNVLEKVELPSSAKMIDIPFLRLSNRYFTACGCSAAVFGFLGVEVVYLFRDLYRMSSKKYTVLQRYRAEERVARLLYMGIWKLGHVYAMMEGFLSNSSSPVISVFGNGAGEMVGHAAHLGGFLAGVLVAPFLLD